jgi:hypothetical protein
MNSVTNSHYTYSKRYDILLKEDYFIKLKELEHNYMECLKTKNNLYSNGIIPSNNLNCNQIINEYEILLYNLRTQRYINKVG